MNNEQYHKAEGISKSGLDLIHKSPAHYIENKNNGRVISPAQQAVFDVGSLTHSVILEPEKVNEEYVVAPKLDKRTKAGKAEWAELMESGKKVVGIDDFKLAEDMRNSVMAHPSAAQLLVGGEAEQSFFWKDEENGVICKVRPDYLKGDTIVDFKTTVDASPKGFAKSIANYRYHVQAAFYLDGLKEFGLDVNRFIFVAVEKTPPFAVGVYELSPEDMERGRVAYKKDLSVYSLCTHIQEWQAYSDDVEIINLPSWA